MFGFDTTSLIVLAVVIVGGYFGGRFLFNKDTAIEDRRRGAGNLAGVLRQYGLKRLPRFLVDYSVGDYSGMGARLSEAASLFNEGEEAVVAEFDQVFESVLNVKLKRKESRDALAARLAEAESEVKDQESRQKGVSKK